MQVPDTSLLPTTVVPTLAGAVPVALVLCLVLVAVWTTTIRHQCWTPWVLARYARSIWHTITPSLREVRRKDWKFHTSPHQRKQRKKPAGFSSSRLPTILRSLIISYLFLKNISDFLKKCSQELPSTIAISAIVNLHHQLRHLLH